MTRRALMRQPTGYLPAVDAGGGWLIFALPPAELAVHPANAPCHELYFMCDDLTATIVDLRLPARRLGRFTKSAGAGPR